MIDRPVHELMEQNRPSVESTTTIKDLISLLASQGLDGVAVVDPAGLVVGIVTAQDLLYQEVEVDEATPYVTPFLDALIYMKSIATWERHVEKALAVTVADLMTTDVHTTTSLETVHEAAKRMAEHSVSQLPVVDAGRLVGMFTRGNVVVALNRFEFGGDAA